jgi:hypothetical protein
MTPDITKMMAWGAFIVSVLVSAAFIVALIIAYIAADTQNLSLIMGSVVSNFSAIRVIGGGLLHDSFERIGGVLPLLTASVTRDTPINSPTISIKSVFIMVPAVLVLPTMRPPVFDLLLVLLKQLISCRRVGEWRAVFKRDSRCPSANAFAAPCGGVLYLKAVCDHFASRLL